jgi:hypothetical protein
MSKKDSKDFEKIQKRFKNFFKDEDHQRDVFNALVDVASETLPDVNVTNPSALLNVASNSREDEFNRRWAIVFLIIFILFFLLS